MRWDKRDSWISRDSFGKLYPSYNNSTVQFREQTIVQKGLAENEMILPFDLILLNVSPKLSDADV